MGRVARAEQLARTQARNRRGKAREKDRRDRDRRIEDALAEVTLALEARDHAGRLAEYAETRIGGALRRLLADDVDVAQAAQLCEMTVQDVRRLSRQRRTRRSQPAPTSAEGGAAADQEHQRA